MPHNKDWQEELSHFENSRKIIKHNIKVYEQEYHRRHQESVELFKAIQSGDTELYNQLMTTKSLEEHSENQLRKNNAAYEKPYFGRICFTDMESSRRENIYIGKNGVFRNKTDIVIADWRAPVSTAYYENELGKGSYALPEIKGGEKTAIEIDLHLKRTYDISEGRLNGYYDSDVAANDELLVKYLSRNKDAVLGEIIATIQKEQNEIIRESPFANQIVQGVAGSGKTTVAMHRMSYILYNYKERFTSNEFCVVGSNDLLLDYITSGLPELDVTNIKKMRMDTLFTHLLKKEWKIKYRLTELFADAGGRCSIPFYQELESFLLQKREAYTDVRRLTDRTLGVLLTESNNRSLLDEQSEFSVLRLHLQMDDRVLSRIKSLSGQYEKEILAGKRKEYAGYYKNKFPKVTVTGLYQEFLTSFYEKESLKKPLNEFPKEIRKESRNHFPKESRKETDMEHLALIQKGQFDIYDTAALVLIYYRMFQKDADEEFGQIFIDEAQDFGSGLFFVLKKVLPACYFTIMGDVSQNINYETGMNEWEELQQHFLTGTKDRFKLLSKSYRNTMEISQYAGRILEKASAGRYMINPVIRHGIPVVEESFWSRDEMADRIRSLIPEIQEREYASIAVICRDDREAGQAEALLGAIPAAEKGPVNGFQKGLMILPVRLTKGLEFDAVILWNPPAPEKPGGPGEAKLLYVAVTRALHELYVFHC